MRRLFVITLFLGCGINEVGERDVLDGSVEAGDAAVDVVKDVAPFVCADAGPASCTDAVPFRTPALFSPDAGAPCPAGYDTHDLVLSVPTAPLCECDCTDGGAPSCDTTLVSYHYGFGGGGCTADSGSYTLNGCTAGDHTTFPTENLQIDPPKVVGGCGGGTSKPPVAASTNVRLCTPQCASDESVCTGATGLRACVAVVGSVGSCPPNYPSGPFDIGEAPQTTCDNCSCVATGDCTGSTTHLYGDMQCGPGDQSFMMDGVCHALGGGQINAFHSSQIKPMFKGPGCNVTQGASHTTYGGNEFTVCCK